MKERKLVMGVGVDDTSYLKTSSVYRMQGGLWKQKRIWSCPYYVRWKSMLTRCYSIKFKSDSPTYSGCTVSEDWLLFSNFRDWMLDVESDLGCLVGLDLDKDILFDNNKCYSKETCVFIHHKVNTFILRSLTPKSEHSLGVCWDNINKKWIAQCRNPFTRRRVFLGRYLSEGEAHKAWRTKKCEFAIQLAKSTYVNDVRVRDRLMVMFI